MEKNKPARIYMYAKKNSREWRKINLRLYIHVCISLFSLFFFSSCSFLYMHPELNSTSYAPSSHKHTTVHAHTHTHTHTHTHAQYPQLSSRVSEALSMLSTDKRVDYSDALLRTLSSFLSQETACLRQSGTATVFI